MGKSIIVGSYMMDKSLNYDYNKYSQIFGKNKKPQFKKDPLSIEILGKGDMTIALEDDDLHNEYYKIKDEFKSNLLFRYKMFLLKSFKKFLLKKEYKMENRYFVKLQNNISYNINKFKELYKLTYLESVPALK